MSLARALRVAPHARRANTDHVYQSCVVQFNVLVVAVAFAMLSAACGRKSERIEGITVYTSLMPDQVKTYLAVFNAEYPNIKVIVVREAFGPLTKRLLAERDDPRADVIWGLAATNVLRLEWHGMLSPYAPDGLERVPSQFRDTSNPPYWVGIAAWMSAFCVNTVQLKKLGLPLPKASWNELIDPVYKGHLTMPNPMVTGTGYMAVAAILQMYGESEGWEYLDALHQNITAYLLSGAKPCRLAGAGEVPIGISFGLAGVKQRDQEDPIDVIFPIEGSGWDMEANALIKKDHIKPAAKTFLDWAIGDSAMRAYSKNYAVTAVKTYASLPEGYPEDPTAQLLDRDFPWGTANRDSILRQWQQRYGDKVAKD